MLASWPLRVEGCPVGSRLFADGEPIGDVPGAVRLRGRSGAVLQLEVRREDEVLGRCELRLHPLMKPGWRLDSEEGEVRTEA